MSIGVSMFKSVEERRIAINECLEKMLLGESVRDIQQHLFENYQISKRENVNNFLASVRNEIAEITSQNLEHIVPLHCEIYEQIYKYFEEEGFIPGKMKAMKYKEKLMGLHKEDRTVEINNKNTTIIEKEVSYETSKLNSEQQTRLNYLLDKAK